MAKKILLLLAVLTAALLILFSINHESFSNLNIRSFNLPENLEVYLKKSESRFSDVRPGTEKTIVWASPSQKVKTPISIIYLHGFSSSYQDTFPLCEIVAKQLGANLFYTRLSGHGRDGQDLGKVTVNDWINDAVEAIKIGYRIGEKVVVIGTSTGANLAIWLTTSEYNNDISALIVLSPNFGLKDTRAKMLNWPYAKLFVPMLIGKNQTWQAQNAQQAQYWNTSYPTVALITMAKLIRFATKSDLKRIKHPVLFVFSPQDQVVNVKKTEEQFFKIKSNIMQIVRIEESQDPQNHIIAGDVISPKNTEFIAQIILDFLENIGAKKSE